MGRTLRLIAALLVAVSAGLLGLAFVFTDLGPATSGSGRALSGGASFLAAGVAIGLLYARGRWWLLAGLASSGMILLGLVGLVVSLTDPASADLRLSLLFLLGPLASALLGGYAGAFLRRARDRPPG